MLLTYKTKVENQLNRKIKRIRSDKGGEYVLFNDYCVKESIIHEVTTPYSSESNGVVKRKNKTLKEKMQVMLISFNASDNLWRWISVYNIFLQNMIPHKKIGKTPYQLWKGYQPNMKYRRVWECLAKVMLLDP